MHVEDVKIEPAPQAAPPAQAAPPPPPQPTVTSSETIVLKRKVGEKFGFSITQDDKSDDLPNVVSRIEPGGIAAKDGRLHIGDRLHVINGEEVIEMDQTGIAALLEAGVTEVALVIERGPSTTKPHKSDEVTGAAFVAGAQLGFSSALPTSESLNRTASKAKAYESKGLLVMSEAEPEEKEDPETERLLASLEDLASDDKKSAAARP